MGDANAAAHGFVAQGPVQVAAPDGLAHRSVREPWTTVELDQPTAAAQFQRHPRGVDCAAQVRASFMMVLTPDDVVRQLSARATALGEKLAGSRAAMKAARSKGLPRLFLLEDEYQQAMMRAEIDWLTSVIADLRSKKITWSKEWIRKVAEAAERDPAV